MCGGNKYVTSRSADRTPSISSTCSSGTSSGLPLLRDVNDGTCITTRSEPASRYVYSVDVLFHLVVSRSDRTSATRRYFGAALPSTLNTKHTFGMRRNCMKMDLASPLTTKLAVTGLRSSLDVQYPGTPLNTPTMSGRSNNGT